MIHRFLLSLLLFRNHRSLLIPSRAHGYHLQTHLGFLALPFSPLPSLPLLFSSFNSSVRGVDGICADHLTVESYTVFICQQSYLLLFRIPPPIHSFIPGLKPSFSANPSHCSPSFLLLRGLNIHYVDPADCLLLFLSISVFYF